MLRENTRINKYITDSEPTGAENITVFKAKAQGSGASLMKDARFSRDDSISFSFCVRYEGYIKPSKSPST
jgi:hypothetical protein